MQLAQTSQQVKFQGDKATETLLTRIPYITFTSKGFHSQDLPSPFGLVDPTIPSVYLLRIGRWGCSASPSREYLSFRCGGTLAWHGHGLD